jgi:hypothetical protein
VIHCSCFVVELFHSIFSEFCEDTKSINVLIYEETKSINVLHGDDDDGDGDGDGDGDYNAMTIITYRIQLNMQYDLK